MDDVVIMAAQTARDLHMIVSGSKAVVTGGASGIGRAIACELAARGAQVLIADINSARAESTAAEIGLGVIATHCDVASHDSVNALAEHADKAIGGIDLVFANAGVSVGGGLLDATPAALDWIYGVNVRGAWNTLSVFGKRMRDSGRTGHVCLTGSEHSLGMQHAGMGLYTLTKMAVLGMADVLRAELPETISVSVLCPGLVETELYLSKRTGPLPQDPDAMLAFAQKVMARGMPAGDVGRAAVEGVERGEFMIVTHAVSLPAARRRWEEIAGAFATHAPPTSEAERYGVNAVIAAVGQDLALGSS